MKQRSAAITLIELIIATLIVSMVIAGVFSADYALRRMNEEGSMDTRVGVQTKTVAEAVRTALKTLHGDAADTGITINTGARTLCFRHDVINGANFTPAVYTDDNYTCFTQVGTGVYRCEKTSAVSCANTDLLIGALVSDQFTNATILAQGPSTVTASGQTFFRMSFVGRENPAAGAAVTAGVLTNGTAANPQAVVRVLEYAGF